MCEHDETRLNFPYHALVKHFERNESAALIFNSETDRIFADSLDGRRRFRCPFRGWSPVSNQLDSNGWNLPDFPHHALVKLQSEWHNLSIKVREEKYQPIGSINHESLSLSRIQTLILQLKIDPGKIFNYAWWNLMNFSYRALVEHFKMIQLLDASLGPGRDKIQTTFARFSNARFALKN